MDRFRLRPVSRDQTFDIPHPKAHRRDVYYSYDAQKGLLWSHLGWIFYKPTYEKLPLIDKKDLDADPVVRMQHRYYIPATLLLGLVAPTLLGALWGDALGGYIWGGVVARLL